MSDTTDTRTTRRGFLGWLGAAGALAIYKGEPVEGAPSLVPTHVPFLRDSSFEEFRPAQSFIIKNLGETPMVIAYMRTPATTPTNEMQHHGKFADGRRSEALLLPGEELSIIAVEMKL